MKSQDYIILLAVFASFVLSIGLWFNGQREAGMYVGLWVPSILALGIYFNSVRIREQA